MSSVTLKKTVLCIVFKLHSICHLGGNIWWVAVFQLPRHVWLFVTPWTAARQVSLSLAISRSLPKFIFIALMMLSRNLILWCPLLLLPSIFPSIRDFSIELVCIRWPKQWSFEGISSLGETNPWINIICFSISFLNGKATAILWARANDLIVTPQRTGLRRTLRMCLYHRSPFLVYCFSDPKLSTYTLTTEINFLGFLVSLTKVVTFGYWFQWTPQILSTSWPYRHQGCLPVPA